MVMWFEKYIKYINAWTNWYHGDIFVGRKMTCCCFCHGKDGDIIL